MSTFSRTKRALPGRAKKTARQKVKQLLPILNEDFQRETGKPFEHFYCPLLHRDQDTELCVAHIVNQAIEASFDDWVVQRKDVDGWYGAMFEPEFTTLVRAQESGDVLFDGVLRKRMPTCLTANGVEYGYHEYRGGKVAQHHSLRIVRDNDRREIPLVVHIAPAEMQALDKARWQLEIGADYSLPGLVSMIKAGFLTMFRLCRYTYALGADGIQIGRLLLGKFYLENVGLPKEQIRRNGVAFFQSYVNMARPIEGYSGARALGTVEDHNAQLCVTRGGKHFGVIVCVRAAGRRFAVLMPYWYDVSAAVAYEEFLTNDCEILRTHHCVFEPKTERFVAEQPFVETHWPKSPDNILRK
jgi:hypothetical protein